MEVSPDFGYEGDNFVLERDEDAPKNWKLMSEVIAGAGKHEWLKNHIELRHIRQMQQAEERQR